MCERYLTPKEEADLVKKWQEGEEAKKKLSGGAIPAKEKEVLERRSEEGCKAEGKLYCAFRQALIGYIRGWRIQQQDAEDLAYETWQTVRQNISKYDEKKGKFYTFLRNLAKWQILQFFRKQGRRADIKTLLSEHPELTIEDIAVVPPKPPGKAEDERIWLAAYAVLLSLTFTYGGPPHQTICFGFDKLVDEWTPTKIVGQLSKKTLLVLSGKLREDYKKESELTDKVVEYCFVPLFKKMPLTVDQVLDRRDKRSRKRLHGILAKRVSTTILDDYYYGNNHQKCVTDWTYKVARKVEQIAGGKPYI